MQLDGTRLYLSPGMYDQCTTGARAAKMNAGVPDCTSHTLCGAVHKRRIGNVTARLYQHSALDAQARARPMHLLLDPTGHGGQTQRAPRKRTARQRSCQSPICGAAAAPTSWYLLPDPQNISANAGFWTGRAGADRTLCDRLLLAAGVLRARSRT